MKIGIFTGKWVKIALLFETKILQLDPELCFDEHPFHTS